VAVIIPVTETFPANVETPRTLRFCAVTSRSSSAGNRSIIFVLKVVPEETSKVEPAEITIVSALVNARLS